MLVKLKKIVSSAKSFLAFSLLSVIGNALTAFSPLIVAKTLNPEGFGSYSLSMGFVFLFCAILINSSQAPCIIFASQELEKSGKANKTLTLLLAITLGSAFISLFILFVGHDAVQSFTKNSSPLIWLFVFFAFSGYALKSLAQNILLGFNIKNLSALIEVAFGFTGLIGIGLLSIFNSISAATALSTYLFAGVITLIIPLFKIKKDTVLPLTIDKELVKKLFHFTKWQFVGLTAIYLVNWGDNIVLRIFVDIDHIGIYNLAYKLFSGIATIIFFVNIYFLPQLSKKAEDTSYLKDFVQEKKWRFFTLLLLGVILAVFIIPFGIERVYGTPFKEAGNIFRILCIALLAQCFYVFYIPLLNVLNRYKFIQFASVMQIAINLGLDFLLIPHLGIQGAALATCIGYVALALMYEIYTRTSLRVYFERS